MAEQQAPPSPKAKSQTFIREKAVVPWPQESWCGLIRWVVLFPLCHVLGKALIGVSTHFRDFPSSPHPSVFSWGLFFDITTSRLAVVLILVLIEVNCVDCQKWDWHVFLLWSLETQTKGVFNSLKTLALDSWSYKILPVTQHMLRALK